MEWETVIGLEVHVQLATDTKLFSGSSTAYGAEPNTQASANDLAMPGTLPVPNEAAFRYAVMFGLAVNAEIAKRSVFERKNYFYPDLPKGYQTTQLAEPIVGPGYVDIELENGQAKRIRIHHAHLEEDAGKSLHEDFHGMTGIDLNRAGTPLIEVVTEPDMRNAEEAVAFAKKLHNIVTSLEIFWRTLPPLRHCACRAQSPLRSGAYRRGSDQCRSCRGNLHARTYPHPLPSAHGECVCVLLARFPVRYPHSPARQWARPAVWFGSLWADPGKNSFCARRPSVSQSRRLPPGQT